MLRLSVLALLGMLVFGLVFALLPAAPSVRSSGVTLQNVRLQLYPAQDADAEWRFSAAKIDVDPEKGETALDQLGQGARWVQTRGKDGSAGPLHEDMRIKASNLVIDGQDNLRAQQAELYTIADCSTFTLSALGDQQVFINQQGGYTAPRGSISTPSKKGDFRDISANFDFTKFQAVQVKNYEQHTVSPLICVGGTIRPR
ncbi:hypothetical protein [Deinococcus sp.]|uniref:hypothetical protein n=1 Tax=Deinococcus sp. TaxID=47478 RepID=UPI0025DF0AFE|nr:hypothetical protein [Deinococcus sp.]